MSVAGIAKQVHQHDPRKHGRIIMDNNSEYQKNLQEIFPGSPDKWTKALPATAHRMRRLEKGARRWVDLPTTADYSTEVCMRPPDYSGQDTESPRRQALYNPMPELSSLRYAVEGWRSAWKMKNTWQSATIEGLKRDLTDLHIQVRISAIATCASGAVNRPREEQHPPDAVPRELQPLILRALEDPVKRVQMAAAVCQYAMGTPGSRARKILRRELDQGFGADSWVAAQCLAMEGDASRPVIQRLLSQRLVSGTHSDQEQSASLLASISSKTTLVHSLLAEDLNCANWRTRLLACKTISRLKNPDLTNKLIHLMWNDWSGEVRQMAARALGKLGAGRAVHNGLRDKLEEGTASCRVESLILVGQLQIMTAKLLPAFLRCFNDNFVAVRKQACVTAAALMMKDSLVLNQLIHLMKNDPAWEVKVAAISASGTIGCLTPTLHDLLLWVLHHEEEPQVRIAACEALKVLRVKGLELQHLLQERFIQRLSTKSIITDKVLLIEELADMYQQQTKYQGEESQTDTPPVLQLLQERYKGQ
uniref:HEAT repeat containing 4 n=1 Tax=Esox lucius TaxID=8010 RepID=A0A3P8ZDF5_ESOLU